MAPKQQFQGAPTSDKPRQALRPTVPGNQTQVDLGLAQSRRVHGYAQRARHGQLAPPAQRVAIDGGDHGLAQGLEEVEHVLTPLGRHLGPERGLLGQLGDIGAGDEGLFARAGDDHGAHAVVVPNLQHGAPQLVHRGRVQGVETLGAIDGDCGDSLVARHQQVCGRHVNRRF
jgi:hypothetical protein